ncbi:MAG: hypothetical protein ACE5OZ_16090 [Candidatus Heimdallarchaeota archaeon]
MDESESPEMSVQFLQLQGLRALQGLRGTWDAIRSAKTIAHLIDHAALVQRMNEAIEVLITQVRSSPHLISDYNVRRSTIEAVENIKREVMDLFNVAANNFTWKTTDEMLKEYAHISIGLGRNAIISSRTYSAPRLMRFLQSIILDSNDPAKTAILMRYFLDNLGIFDDLPGITQELSDLIRIAARVGSLGMTEAYDFRILSHMIGKANDGSLILIRTGEGRMTPMSRALECLEDFHDDINEALRELTGQTSLARWMLSDLELISEIGVDVGGIYNREILEIWRSIEDARSLEWIEHKSLGQRIRNQWYLYQLLRFVERLRNVGIKAIEAKTKCDWTAVVKVFSIDLLEGNEGEMLRELSNMLEYMSGYPGYIVNTQLRNPGRVSGFLRRFDMSLEEWRVGLREGNYHPNERHISRKHFGLSYFASASAGQLWRRSRGWDKLRFRWKRMIADMWMNMGNKIDMSREGSQILYGSVWRLRRSTSGTDLVPGRVSALARLNELILIKKHLDRQYDILPRLGVTTRGATLDVYDDMIRQGLRIRISASSKILQAVQDIPENAQFFDNLHDSSIWIEDALGNLVQKSVADIFNEGLDNAEYVVIEVDLLRSLLIDHRLRLDELYPEALSTYAGSHTGELALGDLAEIIILSGVLGELDASQLGVAGRLYVEVMQSVRQGTFYLDESCSLSAAHAYSRASLETKAPIDHILCYRHTDTERPVYAFICDKVGPVGEKGSTNYRLKKDFRNVQTYFSGDAEDMVTSLEGEYQRGMWTGVGKEEKPRFMNMRKDFREISVRGSDRIVVHRTMMLARANDWIPEFIMDLQFGNAAGGFLASQVYGVLTQAGGEWAEVAQKIDATVELAARIGIDPDTLWEKTFWVKNSVGDLLPPDEILNNFQKGFRKLDERLLNVNLVE